MSVVVNLVKGWWRPAPYGVGGGSEHFEGAPRACCQRGSEQSKCGIAAVLAQVIWVRICRRGASASPEWLSQHLSVAPVFVVVIWVRNHWRGAVRIWRRVSPAVVVIWWRNHLGGGHEPFWGDHEVGCRTQIAHRICGIASKSLVVIWVSRAWRHACLAQELCEEFAEGLAEGRAWDLLCLVFVRDWCWLWWLVYATWLRWMVVVLLSLWSLCFGWNCDLRSLVFLVIGFSGDVRPYCNVYMMVRMSADAILSRCYQIVGCSVHNVNVGNKCMNDDLSEWVDESYVGECAKPVRDNVHPVSRGWISSADALTIYRILYILKVFYIKVIYKIYY